MPNWRQSVGFLTCLNATNNHNIAGQRDVDLSQRQTSGRLTNRLIATRKAFQVRMILQSLLHVYLRAALKGLYAVDDVLPSRHQSNLLRLRLGLAGSDRVLECSLL